VIEDVPHYSREDLIAALQELTDELGHSPTVAELRAADGYPPVQAFFDMFGSWNEAKEEAGLETYSQEGREQTYSDEELIDILQDIGERVDGVVTRDDVDDAEESPSWMTYRRHFGSWSAAKEEAGLETVPRDEPHPKYTDTELLEMLRQRSDELGRPVTQADIRKSEDLPALSTFENRFGSWNQAKKEAGLATFDRGERVSDKDNPDEV